ncbi:MAG: ribosomal protection-like ABC-F family protein [Planctomycetota bacterium]|jgi:ATP-binding cassette subfamily F protein 3
MAIISLQDVHFGYEAHPVLQGMAWEIQRGRKVGLVGANGSGKTTLFKLMLGQLKPQIGTVTKTRGLQLAYLPQEPMLDSDNTLINEITATFDNLRQLEQRLIEVAQQITEHHHTDRAGELMTEYDELHHRLEAAGGYKYETLVKEVLGGLGFTTHDYHLPISTLSGGQKCRAALAKLLLAEADLLLLDEPTNHLDIEATRFLEKFLAGYHGTAVIVSHDRYLLDRVVDNIAELDQKKITVYPCAYSDYAESKRISELTNQREFEKQQAWMQHQREYAQRVKADKSRSKQAKGRLRYLERMEREGKVLQKTSLVKRKMAIDLTPARRAGDMVLRCQNVRKAYGEIVLFDDFNLEIYRGEKIGIIGPNGVGKTTLIKMAMRSVKPDAGEVRLFENLDVGYYDQEHEDLNLNHTVIDEIQTHRTASQEAEIRSFLARFLFFGDEVFKLIGDMSGGQQSRVTLAKLVWAKPQVLVLDEPTNHLDIPGKEALEEALIAYQGAILIISHDRYFLDRVINKMLVLPQRGKYETIAGNWSTYQQIITQRQAEQRKAAEQARAQARQANKTASRKTGTAVVTDNSPYAKWSLDQIEEAIIQREDKLDQTEQQFADPSIYRNPEKARSLRAEANNLRAELTKLKEAWEIMADEE